MKIRSLTIAMALLGSCLIARAGESASNQNVDQNQSQTPAATAQNDSSKAAPVVVLLSENDFHPPGMENPINVAIYALTLPEADVIKAVDALPGAKLYNQANADECKKFDEYAPTAGIPERIAQIGKQKFDGKYSTKVLSKIKKDPVPTVAAK